MKETVLEGRHQTAGIVLVGVGRLVTRLGKPDNCREIYTLNSPKCIKMFMTYQEGGLTFFLKVVLRISVLHIKMSLMALCKRKKF